MLNVAILDDYTDFALKAADWSQLPAGATVTAFNRPLSQAEAVTALAPFDVLCTIRERMPLPRPLIEQLPRLKLIVMVGPNLANLDMAAATERGIKVARSKFTAPPADVQRIGAATPELCWGLMLATVRHIGAEHRGMRGGGWQSTLGVVLEGRRLGLLGLGKIGRRMAGYAAAFGMEVIAWSQNLTPEAAREVGARWVEKDDLFRQSDILSVHLVLSERSRGLVGGCELGLMKPTAYVINTSRGPIIDEAALVAALRGGTIAGAGLDVFDTEPLPPEHPLRQLDNVTLTPHLGYATEETLRVFLSGMPATIAAFASGGVLDLGNPEVLG